MIRRLAFLFLLFALPTFAQRTIVSGTVSDSSGLLYAGASLTATLSLPTGAIGAYLGGAQIAGTVGPVQLDTTGSFLLQLADNTQIQCANAVGQLVACAPQTQWSFRVTLSPGAPAPLGTGPQTCSATLTISGVSQSVTPSFNACPALSTVTTHFPLAAPSGSAAAPSYGSLSFPGQGMFFTSGGVCLSTFNDGGHGICFNTSAGNIIEQNLAAGAIQLQAQIVPVLSQQNLHNAHPLRPIELGSCAMVASTTCTFTTTASYNSTPLGFANPQSTIATTANQAICTVSGTTATITAALSNSLTWNCALIGNPD